MKRLFLFLRSIFVTTISGVAQNYSGVGTSHTAYFCALGCFAQQLCLRKWRSSRNFLLFRPYTFVAYRNAKFRLLK